MWNHNYTIYSISVVFFVLYLFCIPFISIPWVDEIGTADTSINVLNDGIWMSNVWKYSYNPLHAFLLILWLYIFGITHLSVCGFGAFIALISSIALTYALRKRKIINDDIQGILFIVLFWLGWNMITIVPSGRIDTLSMLFVILVIDSFTTDDASSPNTKYCFISSFLLILTNVYAIPLLLIFILFYFFNNQDKKRLLFKRLKCIICASIFAFLLICLFYIRVHQFVGYINTFFSFNATVNPSSKISLLSRIFNAYKEDYFSIILLVVTAIISLFIVKEKLSLKQFLFVVLIPVFMVISGRYTVFYSWLFYIPCIILFIYYSGNRVSRRINTLFICIFITIGFSRMIFLMNSHKDDRILADKISGFVDTNMELFDNSENVLFINELCYYPLQKRDCKLWYHFQRLDDELTPNQKFHEFIMLHFTDSRKRETIWNLYTTLQDDISYYPSNGMMFCTSYDEMNTSNDFFKSHGYSSKVVQTNGPIYILEFLKE